MQNEGFYLDIVFDLDIDSCTSLNIFSCFGLKELQMRWLYQGKDEEIQLDSSRFRNVVSIMCS